jgi:hypothetical protein
MDEMVVAAVGAAAAVALLGRGLRPMGKMMMRGVVAATEATGASKRGIQGLYDEVKAEREQGGVPVGAGTTPEASAAPAAGAPGASG